MKIQGESPIEELVIEATNFGVTHDGYVHFDVDRYDNTAKSQWNTNGLTDGVALYLTPVNARKLARKLLKLAQ